MAELKEEIEKLEKDLREKLDRYDRTVRGPEAKALLGRCFRYRNCYSCPETEADYWWAYSRIISVDGICVELESFEIDSDGDFRCQPNRVGVYSSFIDGNYKPITRREYDAARKTFLKKLSERLHNRNEKGGE